MGLVVIEESVLEAMLRTVVREEISKPKPPVYLTVEETAEMLNCSTSTVRNNKKKIKEHQPGGAGTAISFEIENIRAYMKSKNKT